MAPRTLVEMANLGFVELGVMGRAARAMGYVEQDFAVVFEVLAKMSGVTK